MRLRCEGSLGQMTPNGLVRLPVFSASHLSLNPYVLTRPDRCDPAIRCRSWTIARSWSFRPATSTLAPSTRSQLFAWIDLGYLITAGSVLGFTAYLWLLRRDSPTRVGTCAYVNPVVAMILGAFLGAERVGVRSLVGSGLIMFSVIASVLWLGPRRIDAYTGVHKIDPLFSAVSKTAAKD
jgi:hypothetical protein